MFSFSWISISPSIVLKFIIFVTQSFAWRFGIVYILQSSKFHHIELSSEGRYRPLQLSLPYELSSKSPRIVSSIVQLLVPVLEASWIALDDLEILWPLPLQIFGDESICGFFGVGLGEADVGGGCSPMKSRPRRSNVDDCLLGVIRFCDGCSDDNKLHLGLLCLGLLHLPSPLLSFSNDVRLVSALSLSLVELLTFAGVLICSTLLLNFCRK
jgi:hypothetical protein